MIVRYKFFAIRQDAEITMVKLSRALGNSLVAEEFMHPLVSLIDDVGPVTLVLDFAEVESCPSAVIAALLVAQRQLQALGGRMKLSIPFESVRVVFQRLNLNQMFDIYHNQDDAIRACREESKSD